MALPLKDVFSMFPLIGLCFLLLSASDDIVFLPLSLLVDLYMRLV